MAQLNTHYCKTFPFKIPISELENKRQFKCMWISSNLSNEREVVLYPNRYRLTFKLEFAFLCLVLVLQSWKQISTLFSSISAEGAKK